MYATISPSDASSGDLLNVPSGGATGRAPAQRTTGTGRVSFKADGEGHTRLDRLYQQGCAKIRLPRVYGGNAAEAVLINSSGGLTGGDIVNWQADAATGTYAVVTTQACEKIYKADSGVARVSNHVTVADGARLDWLPQETILYDRAGLHRSLDVHLAGSARFMAVESLLLGRLAMGEVLRSLAFRDSWRIHRNGRLIHAEAQRLEGDVARIGLADAVLSGHLALATLCYTGPEDSDTMDALVDSSRALMQPFEDCTVGLSGFNGKILARLTATNGMALRAALIPLISHFRTGEPLPRVWTT
nr:urease accessory protein UreD [uncultured Cohaesibacter sp.]